MKNEFMIFKNLEFSFMVIVIMLLLNAQKRNKGGLDLRYPDYSECLLWYSTTYTHPRKPKNKKQKTKEEKGRRTSAPTSSRQWTMKLIHEPAFFVTHWTPIQNNPILGCEQHFPPNNHPPPLSGRHGSFQYNFH